MNSAFRKTMAWLHTWSGLTIGLVAVLLAVTGAALILRIHLDAWVNRDLLVVPACTAPLTLDALAAKARAAHPADELRLIQVLADPEASTAVQFSNSDYVYLDPCSGAVLGTQNEYGGFFGTMDWLHRFRFINETAGRQVAGWATLVFLVILIIGGVYLWWPRSKAAARTAFKFNPRLPGTARTLSLHKIVGLYSSLALLLIALTAVPIAFLPVKNLIYRMTGYVEPVPPHSRTPHAGVQGLPMQSAWQQTRTTFPETEWAALYYPPRPDDSIKVEIRERNMPHANAKSYLYLDAYSGDVLTLSRYATDMPLGRKVYLYCIGLHAALVGGLPYQLLLLLAVLAVPVQTYAGFSPYLRRKFRRQPKTTLSLKLVRRTQEAADICSFEFADPAGAVLPPFSAGSHIDVHLGQGISRQYSLCNDPLDKHRYVVGVLREEHSRGGSSSMHEGLTVGDIVEIGPPKNHFPLAHGATHSLLLAGGIGVTPILCMAERLSNIGADFTMHYCVRSHERAAFMDRIRASAFAERVELHVSAAGDRLDIARTLGACLPETHLYVCGPVRFIDAALDAAAALDWPEEQVHREYFEAVGHDASKDVAFDVKIASTGKILHVPQDRAVTAVLAEHGIDIPTSCSQGVCGTCMIQVIEGDIEHNDMILSVEERARNDRFMPCCSRARGSMLVLDL